ncbi:MAG: acetylglutamate kinase [Acidimicrobiia bacterium]|nr:acetylglutamate kinase [Acidimicrobiia bacterium]
MTQATGAHTDHEASHGFEPERRARALVEALPYIRRFRGAVVVVKYGGHAMTDAALAASFARDIVLVRSVGLHPVVVHGGAPQIAEHLRKLGKQSEFRDGLRVTDAETLEVARMVLVGKVGRDIVSAINASGGAALGLSGEDGRLVTAVRRDPALGFVGDVAAVNPGVIERLVTREIVPVVSSIGADTGGQAYNINADTMAAALAGALGAAKVVYLTDVPGLLADPADVSSLVSRATVTEVEAMVTSGAVSGGMIPKARACVDAVLQGAGSAHMLDGRIPHAVLLELFTDAGIGTMITRNHEEAGDGSGASSKETREDET